MKRRQSAPATAPGCAPFLQGYLAAARGDPRDPPGWHPGQKANAWRDEWLAGYDDKMRWDDDEQIRKAGAGD